VLRLLELVEKNQFAPTAINANTDHNLVP